MKLQNILSVSVPIIASICLLAYASRFGQIALVLAAIPGALILTGGIRSVVFADYWAPHHIVVGSVLALLLAVPLGLVGGYALGCGSLIVALVGWIAGGWIQIRLQPSFDEIPAPSPSPLYSARVALDDALLSIMLSMSPRTTPLEQREAVRESEVAYEYFAERGWIERPWEYHSTPPGIDAVKFHSLRIKSFDCEHICFESGYEPEVGLPGRERFLDYTENRTGHAYILRRKEPAPWLICVHGAGMGEPRKDFKTFRVGDLHERSGVNVALFTMPFHGLRALGRISGAKFMGLSVVDFLHAMSQAVWDLRRLIHWIRTQDAMQVGICGISLGAYTSAVLAAFEDDLACVIAAIPPANLIHTRDFLASTQSQRMAAAAGVNNEQDMAIHSVVSPLRLSPRVEWNRRFMFAATGDQFVPLEQTRELWMHWDKPHISWCKGGHLSAIMQHEFGLLVDEAVTRSFGAGAGIAGAPAAG